MSLHCFQIQFLELTKDLPFLLRLKIAPKPPTNLVPRKNRSSGRSFLVYSASSSRQFSQFSNSNSSNSFLDQSGIGLIPNRNFACSIGLFIGAIRSLNEIIKGALKALQGVWTRENPFGGTRRTAKMMNERDTWKISSFVSKNSKLRSQVQVKHSRRVHRKEILNDNLLQYPSCEQTFHKYRSTRKWKTSFLQVFEYLCALFIYRWVRQFIFFQLMSDFEGFTSK